MCNDRQSTDVQTYTDVQMWLPWLWLPISPLALCLEMQHAWSSRVASIYVRLEVIFKKSSNLYCRLDLVRVLMVGTKVSKGFFV